MTIESGRELTLVIVRLDAFRDVQFSQLASIVINNQQHFSS